MDRALEFGFKKSDIEHLDQAVLASAVVRAKRLFVVGNIDRYFCEMDSDLQPWDRTGQRLELLSPEEDDANV